VAAVLVHGGAGDGARGRLRGGLDVVVQRARGQAVVVGDEVRPLPQRPGRRVEGVRRAGVDADAPVVGDGVAGGRRAHVLDAEAGDLVDAVAGDAAVVVED